MVTYGDLIFFCHFWFDLRSTLGRATRAGLGSRYVSPSIAQNRAFDLTIGCGNVCLCWQTWSMLEWMGPPYWYSIKVPTVEAGSACHLATNFIQFLLPVSPFHTPWNTRILCVSVPAGPCHAALPILALSHGSKSLGHIGVLDLLAL